MTAIFTERNKGFAQAIITITDRYILRLASGGNNAGFWRIPRHNEIREQDVWVFSTIKPIRALMSDDWVNGAKRPAGRHFNNLRDLKQSGFVAGVANQLQANRQAALR